MLQPIGFRSAETSVGTRVLERETQESLVAERFGLFSVGHVRVARPAVLPKCVIVAAPCVVQVAATGAARIADTDDPLTGFAARMTAAGGIYTPRR